MHLTQRLLGFTLLGSDWVLWLLVGLSIVSVTVMAIALACPLVLYWFIEKTGYGRFLFERPAWAHIPGTPGSRDYARPAVVPAE